MRDEAVQSAQGADVRGKAVGCIWLVLMFADDQLLADASPCRERALYHTAQASFIEVWM